MLSQPGSFGVPVFDCHVLLRKPSEPGGPWQARCAAAPDVVAEGSTEREALQGIVIRFKYFVTEHHSQGRPIPWKDPEDVAAEGEVDRWISVHL